MEKTNKQQFKELYKRTTFLENEVIGLRKAVHALAGTISAIQPVLHRLIATQLVFENKGLITPKEIVDEKTDRFFDEKLIAEMHDRSRGNRTMESNNGHNGVVVPGSESVRESAQGDVVSKRKSDVIELPGVREGDGGDDKVDNTGEISSGKPSE